MVRLTRGRENNNSIIAGPDYVHCVYRFDAI